MESVTASLPWRAGQHVLVLPEKRYGVILEFVDGKVHVSFGNEFVLVDERNLVAVESVDFAEKFEGALKAVPGFPGATDPAKARTSTPKQTEVNEVPLSKELQKDLDKFLQGVNSEPECTAAFVMVFRPNDSRVHVNVASWELTEELQDKMVKALKKALKGEPLFYSFG